MKRLLAAFSGLVVLCLSLNVTAADTLACTNFSGQWRGRCTGYMDQFIDQIAFAQNNCEQVAMLTTRALPNGQLIEPYGRELIVGTAENTQTFTDDGGNAIVRVVSSKGTWNSNKTTLTYFEQVDDLVNGQVVDPVSITVSFTLQNDRIVSTYTMGGSASGSGTCEFVRGPLKL